VFCFLPGQSAKKRRRGRDQLTQERGSSFIPELHSFEGGRPEFQKKTRIGFKGSVGLTLKGRDGRKKRLSRSAQKKGVRRGPVCKGRFSRAGGLGAGRRKSKPLRPESGTPNLGEGYRKIRKRGTPHMRGEKEKNSRSLKRILQRQSKRGGGPEIPKGEVLNR